MTTTPPRSLVQLGKPPDPRSFQYKKVKVGKYVFDLYIWAENLAMELEKNSDIINEFISFFVAASAYDLAVSLTGKPTASFLLLKHAFALPVTFPAGLGKSQAHINVAATAQTDFDITKNGSSIGTCSFAIAATTATFSMAADQSFVAGDLLRLISPATPDATAEDVSITISGVQD